jgi:hypothetical protein
LDQAMARNFFFGLFVHTTIQAPLVETSKFQLQSPTILRGLNVFTSLINGPGLLVP